MQGNGFRSEYQKFLDKGAVILGASFDSVAENRAFALKFDYPFQLLCDTDRSLGMAYGACDDAKAGYARRITYVIGPDGIVQQVMPRVDPATHTARVLSLIP